MAKTYEIQSLADIVRTYAELPSARGELFLKELGDAVRMIAPFASVVDLSVPLKWIDDDKGVGTVNFQTTQGEELGQVKVNLKAGQSQ